MGKFKKREAGEVTPLRVLVVDDHALIRTAMVRFLRTAKSRYQVCEAGNGQEAVDHLASAPADLILMDIQMPVMNGVTATKILRERYRDLKILILSQLDEVALVVHLLKLGADGFVAKTDDIDDLETAIRSTMKGELFVSRSVREQLNAYQRSPEHFPTLSLTPREYQILALIARGLSNKEMADQLHLEVLTVESYRKSLMSKTKASNVADLVSFAYNTGLTLKSPGLPDGRTVSAEVEV
jgi:DNA-binding NarL/FixJ family response regulator